jgi:RimJ/RimL family protein N-acetyltransferase
MLTTNRLLIRDFTENDWPTVLAYQSHPDYLKYTSWESRTPTDVQNFIRLFIGWKNQIPRIKYQMAVVLPDTHEVIGCCGIRKNSSDAIEADIGYELNPAYWGNGYATEIVNRLLEFGFNELKLHRIWSFCIAENTASRRVLEKTGFKKEGLCRENDYFKGRYWNTLIFGILKKEWLEKNHFYQ